MPYSDLKVPEHHPNLRSVHGVVEFRLTEAQPWQRLSAAESSLRPAIADIALSAWRAVLLQKHMDQPAWEQNTGSEIETACQACVRWEEFRHKVQFF